jgi:SAM-dependent methyltransferase
MGVGRLHERYVHSRRVRVLADALAPLLPESGTLLDVGCGDGRLTRLLADRRPALRATGIEVLVRGHCEVPVRPFDGRSIPFPDDSFDVVTAVDVLHHAEDPGALLREMARAGRRIVLKDHTRDGWMADATLRLMDRAGNARHGVALPHNYWSTAEWMREIRRLRLVIDLWQTDVPLYPPPASWIFGRRLHVIAALRRV